MGSVWERPFITHPIFAAIEYPQWACEHYEFNQSSSTRNMLVLMVSDYLAYDLPVLLRCLLRSLIHNFPLA